MSTRFGGKLGSGEAGGMAATIHPSLGEPGDVVQYSPLSLYSASTEEEHPFRVRVPLAEIPTIFAHRLWRAGMLLADLIYSGALPLENKNVLELGAGAGLPSIATHTFGNAKTVVATDYDSPLLVKTLKENIITNTQPISPVRVAGHTWGKSIDDVRDLVLGGSFDVILLADCIWDDLSHADLLKSITSLLCKDKQSRVYMVSGLHTGRSKIVSFLRRAKRQGLHLVAFPRLPLRDWPNLTSSEEAIQEQEKAMYAFDDALSSASEHILEVQVLSHESEEIFNHEDGERIWRANTARLQDNRRSFVCEEREEEKMENQGVHVRNRWITFLALAWQET